MKKIIIIVLLWGCQTVFAQEDAWVYFNDKPNVQAFYDNPLSELSQRALDRRQAQGIALNDTDAPIESSYLSQLAAAPGITLMAQSKWFNCVHVRGEYSDIQNVLTFSFVNHIHYADNSLNLKMATHVPVVKPFHKSMEVQTSFNYGNSANQIEMMNGQYLHQANDTGSGKIIAVLDAGFIGVNTIAPFARMFNLGHYLGGYNFVAGNTDVFSTHNHGTMALSCMVGYQDNQLVGTAPDASYYLYITEDVFSENPVEESYWVQAAEQADRVGADIISTSLGYFEFDNPNYSHTYADMTGNEAFASKGANMAFSKGMIVVASAGNSGGSDEPHVGVPAEATHVFAIGAVDAVRNYVPFSSIGPTYDGRLKPDVMAKGYATTVSDTSGNITTASGTSFSCPVMAGMIASFWQAVPNLTNQQVLDFVKQSADRYSNPNTLYGYGIPDFQQALTNALLSVAQQPKDSTFVVTPNPAESTINISLPEGITSATVVFYNALGQCISQKTIFENNTIAIDSWNSGVYFYKVESTMFSQSGKIIKK